MKLVYLLLAILAVGCTEESLPGNSIREYFYPLNEDDKFYVYRDTVHGIKESIQRVYSVSDSKGDHLVVETYTADGRITEAYNYNQSSLLLDDHMVVDREGKKRQSELLRNSLFPRTDEEKTYFASRFPGLSDSSIFLFEIQNKPDAFKYSSFEYNEKSWETVDIEEVSRFSVIDPISKKENSRQHTVVRRFAKGLGLVEFYNPEGKYHFVLEKILSKKEGAMLLKKM